VRYDAELDMGGKLLYLGNQMLSAGEGLQFSFCKYHVHVTGEPGVNVALEPVIGEPLTVGENAFIEMKDNNLVQLKPLAPAVVALLKSGAIEARDHVYHATSKVAPDALAKLHAVAADESLPEATRSSARQAADALVPTDVPTDTQEHLLASVAELQRRAAAAAASFPNPSPPKPRRP